MGLFDVFKKNDNSEGGEYHNMERSADAPTAEEVRQAVDSPAPAAAPAGKQPSQSGCCNRTGIMRLAGLFHHITCAACKGTDTVVCSSCSYHIICHI